MPGARATRLADVTLSQILETYRSKLRDDLPGAEGDEVVRRKAEEFANKMRPAALLVRSPSR